MKIIRRLERLSQTEICLLAMIILNFIIVVFMALVPALTQIRASEKGALSFLQTLQTLPALPMMRVYLSVTCYILIVLCMILKKSYYHVEENGFFNLSVFEILLVGYLMIILDMSYNGLIFLVVAEFLFYMGNKKNWVGFMIGAFVIYLFCNYYMISLLIPFNSFETWVDFYDAKTRTYLQGIKYICETVNIVFSIVYIFFMILRDKREKQEIQSLNAQLKYANDNLRDANDQLHTFALEKEQMGEMKERNRLAREIHDTLGHILTGISVGVDAVQVMLDISPEAAKVQLTTIGEMARNGLNDVRRSVRKLKPDALESKSLDHAIYEMVDETSKTTGAKIYFVSYGAELHYEADEEETIFRMVQEGTTNALRHGKATEVWIRLDKNEKNVEVTLDDNGKGSDEIVEGFGLSHMRERVEMLGGNITFSSENGFHIHAAIPIRQAQEGGMKK